MEKLTKENFLKLADERGVIGHPSPAQIKEVGMAASLEEFFSLDHELKGKIRDVEMRLYWTDWEGRTEGCISVPKKA